MRCVAVPVGPEPMSWMAVSISGPVTRMTDELVERAVPLLHEAGRLLTSRLHSSTDRGERTQVTEPGG